MAAGKVTFFIIIVRQQSGTIYAYTKLFYAMCISHVAPCANLRSNTDRLSIKIKLIAIQLNNNNLIALKFNSLCQVVNK